VRFRFLAVWDVGVEEAVKEEVKVDVEVELELEENQGVKFSGGGKGFNDRAII